MSTKLPRDKSMSLQVSLEKVSGLLTEEDIIREEEKIPEYAIEAFKEAREEALAAGRTVLVTKDNAIYELFPNGNRIWVKNIEPRIEIKKGTRYIL